jgi:hypothetical protein
MVGGVFQVFVVGVKLEVRLAGRGLGALGDENGRRGGGKGCSVRRAIRWNEYAVQEDASVSRLARRFDSAQLAEAGGECLDLSV